MFTECLLNNEFISEIPSFKRVINESSTSNWEERDLRAFCEDLWITDRQSKYIVTENHKRCVEREKEEEVRRIVE